MGGSLPTEVMLLVERFCICKWTHLPSEYMSAMIVDTMALIYAHRRPRQCLHGTYFLLCCLAEEGPQTNGILDLHLQPAC